MPELTPNQAPGRLTVLYLAPWVDLGGSDRNTVDLLRWLDRDRYRVILATTQESRNRRLPAVAQYVDEVWPMPELVPGGRFPSLIGDLITTRRVDVVHIMNSRLAFDLLPDIAALRKPPGVLVQLHVEEADRSGYVRYVTTRYGNLVDAWSVSSQHLAGIVEGYGIPRDAIEVIYTGIDAEDEFDPARAVPVELEAGAFHLLYLGRWVEQKDPLLMLEIAAGLRDRHPELRVHAVGEGELEGAMRQRIGELGLEQVVLLHPTTSDVQAWFRASDAMLMTSVYEGLPLVLFEAMAMGVPSVTPALPANAELMGEVAGSLIEPRDDVAGYVDAVSALVGDPAHRRAVGEAARARVQAGFGLRDMADRHGSLYERIVAGRGERRRRRSSAPLTSTPTATADEPPAAEELPQLRFRGRRPGEQPLVSVVIPCFNHGHWLDETLRSIELQEYPAVEVIVIDDCSTDGQTIAALAEIERSGRAQVLRMPVNGGPSRARNAGLERARGRYVLPVDADNLLLPDAITRLVVQLSEAGELVGFIYPNQQFFGNRDDYAEAPPWNPYRLLSGNYCDTCSLYDREVFDSGVRYAEDIVLGHEDWDLTLTLVERGVRGEPARGRTVLVRKHGFTRSDLVDYVATDFSKRVRLRHPKLFGDEADVGRFGPFAGPAVRLKAEWSPYLSIVALSAVDAASEEWRRLAQRLRSQTCADAELIAPIEGRREVEQEGPFVRRLPPASSQLRENVLGAGLAMVRGRIALVCRGTGSALLADPAAIEKVALIFENPDVDAIAFRAPESPESVLLGVADDPAPRTPPNALAWRLDPDALPEHIGLAPGDELGSLLRALIRGGRRVHWRYAEGLDGDVALPGRSPRTVARPRVKPIAAPAALPSLNDGVLGRGEIWQAGDSRTICRHRRIGSDERHFSVQLTPPAGFVLDHVLGAAKMFTPPGTTKLYATSSGSFLTTALPEARQAITPSDRFLGSLELVGFLGLDGLLLGVMRATGQHVLLAGRDDPLIGAVEVRAELGWVEPIPLRPRIVLESRSSFGLRGLCRSLDLAERRHRYAVGEVPPGELAGELGALHDEAQEGSVPVWLTDDGRLVGAGGLEGAKPSTRTSARWAAAPLRWQSFGHPTARARAAARRAVDLRRARLQGASPVTAPTRHPVGYLLAQGGTSHVPLYAATHPVTGDQLLTNYPLEAQDMGYQGTALIGWLLDRAPVTGQRTLQRLTVPWASRFGLEARWQ